MSKNPVLLLCLCLLIVLSACAQGSAELPSAAAATQTPAPSATSPAVDTPTSLPAAPTSTSLAATSTAILPVVTRTGIPGATAGLISLKTADGLKDIAQFKQDDPASQWCWTADNKLVVVTYNGYYRYDLAGMQALGFKTKSFADQVLATSADCASAVSMQKDGSLQVWDLAAGKVTATIRPADASMSVTFSPDGKTLAVSSADAIAVTLWDIDSGKLTATLQGFETAAPTYHVQFSPDGQTLVWIARASAQFMEINTGELGSRLSFEDFINSLVFSPDGQTVAIAAAGFTSLTQVSDGKEIQRLTLQSPAVSLAYSPDGKLLAVASGNDIQIINPATGQLIVALNGHTSMVRAVGFALDGRNLASGDDNGNVFIWRVLP